MSSVVRTALFVLQAVNVYGASVVSFRNGVVGGSILLLTEERGPIKGRGFMQWKKDGINIIKQRRPGNDSTLKIFETNLNFDGRLIMSNGTGTLNISSLREEDSGNYDFNGIVSSKSLKGITIQLQIYERIVSVQVTSWVNNGTDGRSCNVTLGCSAIGGSKVVLSWTRNGQIIAGAENKSILTVSPTQAEEIYTCTATNPIGAQSYTVTNRSCRPHAKPGSLYLYVAVGGGSVLLLVVLTLVCILRRCRRGEALEEITIYAEIGEATLSPKGSSQAPDHTHADTFYDVVKRTEAPAAPSTVYDTVKLERVTPTQYQQVL
ncbi:hypothetical protein GJAV_G00090550 [Gymnothorax javanicus]|nr:hypothetical protein GJAV_G00090550 [Gymnothorax javanicus]